MSKIKVNRPEHYIDHVFRSEKKAPCAYCWSVLHRGYLDVKLLKKHKCLQKHCECLQKFPKHPYWVNREKIKQLRIERKMRLKI